MIHPDTPLFDRMKPDEAEKIFKYFVIKNFPEGATIIEKGKKCSSLMVILKGSVLAEYSGGSGLKTERFEQGTLLGETYLFAGKESLEQCMAAESCVLLSISKSNIENMVSKDPCSAAKLLMSVMYLAVKRLKHSSRFLSDIVQWGEHASRRIITDEMTGIYNRQFLDDAMENFFTISKENRKPLSLFMIDLDHCRDINERFGLETGNLIIVEAVRIIRRGIGGQGIISRYGGDEFCVLLPEASSEQALSIAENIRTDVEKFDFAAKIPQLERKITISIGISNYPDNADDAEQFKANADRALYEAKNAGRNRSVLSSTKGA